MGVLRCPSCRWTWIALAVLTLVTTGCGGRRVYPAQGKVVFPDGKPLKGGWVFFEPIDFKANLSFRGRIMHDGTFQMGTYKDTDGACEGRYRVMVTPPVPRMLDEKNPPKPLINPRFEKFSTSKLVVEVKRSNNDFKIVVEKP